MSLYLENMGPRQSIASEILDTIRFGDLDRIKSAGTYVKKKLDASSDAYVLHFGRSKDFYGAVLVHKPNSIEVKLVNAGRKKSMKFKRLTEVKQYFCKSLIL